MEAVKKGNLVLCNGPVARIVSNKLNLALLSEHQDTDMFTLEERETIKKHIPWTRKIVDVDSAFLLDRREHLVLNPLKDWAVKRCSSDARRHLENGNNGLKKPWQKNVGWYRNTFLHRDTCTSMAKPAVRDIMRFGVFLFSAPGMPAGLLHDAGKHL